MGCSPALLGRDLKISPQASSASGSFGWGWEGGGGLGIFANPIMTLKNIGIKRTATQVDPNIPPMIPAPTECCALAPAPWHVTKGTAPRMNAMEVITIGRNLNFAA